MIALLCCSSLTERTPVRLFLSRNQTSTMASIPADCFSKCVQALFFLSFCVFIPSSLGNNAGFLPSCWKHLKQDPRLRCCPIQSLVVAFACHISDVLSVLHWWCFCKYSFCFFCCGMMLLQCRKELLKDRQKNKKKQQIFYCQFFVWSFFQIVF